jgi:hypothetical protein
MVRGRNTATTTVPEKHGGRDRCSGRRSPRINRAGESVRPNPHEVRRNTNPSPIPTHIRNGHGEAQRRRPTSTAAPPNQTGTRLHLQLYAEQPSSLRPYATYNHRHVKTAPPESDNHPPNPDSERLQPTNDLIQMSAINTRSPRRQKTPRATGTQNYLLSSAGETDGDGSADALSAVGGTGVSGSSSGSGGAGDSGVETTAGGDVTTTPPPAGAEVVTVGAPLGAAREMALASSATVGGGPVKVRGKLLGL